MQAVWEKSRISVSAIEIELKDSYPPEKNKDSIKVAALTCAQDALEPFFDNHDYHLPEKHAVLRKMAHLLPRCSKPR